ncbi:MAG: hypothetical protein ACRCVT_05595 [Leadbetterella sp.]
MDTINESQTIKLQSMNMYEYYKMILEKVHFEPTIFKKEFNKAIKLFSPSERKSFREWCKEKFKKKKVDKENDVKN